MKQLLTTLVVVLSLATLAAAPQTQAWRPLGLSGGGAMFTPAISPANPNHIIVNCDMSGVYLATDGGRSWRLIHHAQLRSNTRCRPAFHPTDPNTIYAADSYSVLKVSHDLGQTFRPIGNLPHDLRGEIAIDPTNPKLMLAGTSEHVYRSIDAGQTWLRCTGPQGIACAFHFDQTTPQDRRTLFAATSEGVFRSDDAGLTWADKTNGLPWKNLRHFAAGSNLKTHQCILYVAIPSKTDARGKYTGGVYSSTDRGESWRSIMNPALNMDTKPADQWAANQIAQYHRVLTTNANPSIVYAFNSDTGVRPPHHAAAYRSDDAGQTWRATFYPDPRFTPFNVERDYIVAAVKQFYQDVPTGVAIDPNNPEHVLQLNGMQCYITENGGKTWFPAHTTLDTNAPANDPAWLCNGLVVTTTWNYYIDPHQPRRHYIAYTDIGFARSLDSGKTWKWWPAESRAPWANTCYELAFDPDIPGKIWGAFANVHDIPNSNIIHGRHRSTGPGGVCLSTDFAASWKTSNKGLPLAPALSIVLDPKSPKNARTLYASLFSQGVYKSTDDGQSWTKTSTGLGSPTNLRTCKLYLHPDGSLFVLITALKQNGRFDTTAPGLYRSTDQAKSWRLITKSNPLVWPKDFTVDAKDSRRIFIGAADAPGERQGGLYLTTDAGESWNLSARKGPEHFGAYLSPHHPGWIYMTLTEDAPGPALWLSKDNGSTWAAMNGFPFPNAHRVTFDPKDPTIIYVTTFGASAYRGPASE